MYDNVRPMKRSTFGLGRKCLVNEKLIRNQRKQNLFIFSYNRKRKRLICSFQYSFKWKKKSQSSYNSPVRAAWFACNGDLQLISPSSVTLLVVWKCLEAENKHYKYFNIHCCSTRNPLLTQEPFENTHPIITEKTLNRDSRECKKKKL